MSRELRLELEYNASENLKEKEKGGEPRHIVHTIVTLHDDTMGYLLRGL
jgi:hypothetical protein